MVQDPKTAAMFRGSIDTQLQVSGRGTKFDDIKPTLQAEAGAQRCATENWSA